ncbi:MAG: hypothetical protein IPM60_14350 [Rhodospirillales bacterium]|nr:hypothetical protein [Rhodospirillales bacterium]
MSTLDNMVLNLGKPAVDVLRTSPRLPDSPWVIWSRKPRAHLYGLQDLWERVRARAGIYAVRIHDLSRTFAAAASQGLPMIGKLLGHTQVQTMAR